MAVELLILMTWTTLDRMRRIDEGIAEHLRQLLPILAAKAHAELIELAIVPDHVHVVLRMGAKVDLSMVAQQLKGASARLVNQQASGRIAIRWAAGYDARSVGRRQTAVYRAYLDSQGRHHGTKLLARWSKDTKPQLSVEGRPLGRAVAEPGVHAGDH